MRPLSFVFSTACFLASIAVEGIGQQIYSEVPIVVENGVLKAKRIGVAFKENVIPTERGIRIIDTTRFPIRNASVKNVIHRLSARYGTPTIKKTIPRLVWGDTIVVNKRTGAPTRVPDMSQNFAVDFPIPVPIDSVLGVLRSLPVVKYAEPPIAIQLDRSPNDEHFVNGDQWHLYTIDAPHAWDITIGSSDVRIAIIDLCGPYVVQNHEDFQLPGGGNKFVGGDGSTGEAHPHLVAGVAGAATDNNGLGVASLGWTASLLGYYLQIETEAEKRLPELIDSASAPTSGNADVINFSFKTVYRELPTQPYCPVNFPSVQDAIVRAAGAGVVLVASAGNEARNRCPPIPYPQWPAGYEEVIAVSGTDRNNRFVDAYNFGNFIDVSGPAIDIWTTGNEFGPDGYSPVSGTSFSAPQLSALAALIISVDPSARREQVEEFIMRTAEKVDLQRFPYVTTPNRPYGTWNSHLGYGRINAYKALSMANGPPAIPQSVQAGANPGNNHVRLTWAQNPDPDIDHYEVSRQVQEEGPLWVVIGTTTNTAFVDDDYLYVGYAGDFHVNYRVRAKDAAGLFSGYSSIVNIRGEYLHKPGIVHSDFPFSVEQNYPNPFNAVTTINFSLPSEGVVSLKVFNVLGQGIKTLLNETRTQGRYSVSFEASELPSGLYIYELRHNGRTFRGTMIALK